jgi:hypothetical protein
MMAWIMADDSESKQERELEQNREEIEPSLRHYLRHTLGEFRIDLVFVTPPQEYLTTYYQLQRFRPGIRELPFSNHPYFVAPFTYRSLDTFDYLSSSYRRVKLVPELVTGKVIFDQLRFVYITTTGHFQIHVAVLSGKRLHD